MHQLADALQRLLHLPTAAACASGVCADTVCCDIACDGVCESCNLAAHKGTCYPSTTPRTPCTTDGTVCGGSCDGTDAHRKACSYPPNSTQCVAGICDGSTNTVTDPRMCDGSGRCASVTPRSCSSFTCKDATSCATDCPSGQDTCGGTSCVPLDTDIHCGTCSNNCTANTTNKKCLSGSTCVQCLDDTHCSGGTPICNTNSHACVVCTATAGCSGSTPICSNNKCVQCASSSDCASRSDGKHVCYNNTCVECTTNGDCSDVNKPVCLVSNRTCVQCNIPNDCQSQGYGANSACSGNLCSCHPQDANNVLPNAGFNQQSLSGWTAVTYPDTPALAKYDGANDVDTCKASGSLNLTYYGWYMGSAWACVPVKGSTLYHFGYRYKQMSDYTDQVRCSIKSYYRGDCNENYLADDWPDVYSGAVPANNGWGSRVTQVSTASNAIAARIECWASGLYDVWVDQLYPNDVGHD